ncbi:substrate-binding periplasmic protein [Roseibium sp. MB-4]
MLAKNIHICCTLLICLSAFLSKHSLAGECSDVRLSGPPVWPPYVNGEEKGTERTGLAIDLVNDIFSELGVTHQIDDAKPWARVTSELEQGKIDIVFALLSSPQRRENYVFTESWLDDYYAVVTYRGREFPFEGMEDLKSRRGVVYHGINLPPPLNQAQSEAYDLIEIPEIPSLYKMLRLGRADYILTSPLTFKRLMPDGYVWSDFTVLEPSIVRIPIYMAISKKSPCLTILDNLNAKISEHGQRLKTERYSEIFSN